MLKKKMCTLTLVSCSLMIWWEWPRAGALQTQFSTELWEDLELIHSTISQTLLYSTNKILVKKLTISSSRTNKLRKSLNTWEKPSKIRNSFMSIDTAKWKIGSYREWSREKEWAKKPYMIKDCTTSSHKKWKKISYTFWKWTVKSRIDPVKRILKLSRINSLVVTHKLWNLDNWKTCLAKLRSNRKH